MGVSGGCPMTVQGSALEYGKKWSPVGRSSAAPHKLALTPPATLTSGQRGEGRVIEQSPEGSAAVRGNTNIPTE